MTTYASDSFDRANANALGTADVGGAWSLLVGGWQIFSNTALWRTGEVAHNTAVLAIAQNDVSASADIRLSATTDRVYIGLTVRQGTVPSGNSIYVYLSKVSGFPDNIRVLQNVSSVETVLAEVTSAGLANGGTYNLKAVISGTTIAVYLDGALKVAPTSFNVALTAQQYGLVTFKGPTYLDDGGSWWDNFLVTDNAPDALTPRLNPLLNANIYRM